MLKCFRRFNISALSSFSLIGLRHFIYGCGKNSGYLNRTSGSTAGSRLAAAFDSGADLIEQVACRGSPERHSVDIKYITNGRSRVRVLNSSYFRISEVLATGEPPASSNAKY